MPSAEQAVCGFCRSRQFAFLPERADYVFARAGRLRFLPEWDGLGIQTKWPFLLYFFVEFFLNRQNPMIFCSTRTRLVVVSICTNQLTCGHVSETNEKTVT